MARGAVWEFSMCTYFILFSFSFRCVNFFIIVYIFQCVYFFK